jgi:hypothetical protein
VQHVVEKVDGFLLCPSCKVTAHSESVMRSHLAGKKHKDKAAGSKRTVLAQATSKEATFTGHSQGQDDESVEKSAVDGRSSFSVEIDEHVEAGDRTAKAGEEEEKAVETNGIAAVSGEEVKIQVEGKLFIVFRQADGSLSCGLCSVHGCDKDRMLDHLYTREHWLSEQKDEQAKKAAPAGVVIAITEEGAQVEK